MKFFKKSLIISILFNFLTTCSPAYAMMISGQNFLIGLTTIQLMSHFSCSSSPSRPEINIPLWIPASNTCEHMNDHTTCHWSIPQLENTQTIMIPITCTLPDCLNRPEIVNILHDDHNSDQYNSSAWRYAPFYRLDPAAQQALQNKHYDACVSKRYFRYFSLFLALHLMPSARRINQ